MKAKDAWAAFVVATGIAFLVFLLVGCKTVYVPVVEEHNKDSIRNEVRVDTFYQVLKDSIVVQMPCSDSIQVAYVDRYHTNTVYKVREEHDTIYVAKEDKEPQIVEVEKIVTRNSGFAKLCIWLVCVAFAVMIGYVGFRLFKRFYLHV